MDRPRNHGRGSAANPRNRFERHETVLDEGAEHDQPSTSTVWLPDRSRTLIARNQSPDLGFDASLNPYRGCEHGCAYCYARPTHEYLGFSAGLDFETRILVKEGAALRLREELSSPRWVPRPLALSGVTDPYQPGERRWGVTRACLEVLAEFRNPVVIVTKNHLVTRDVDLLAELASHGACTVFVSITTLDRGLQRVMEPRTSTPERRLDAIRLLSEAGVPAGVMVAPVIPGLTEHEIPSILEAAAQAGARHASWVLLRLPWGVKDLFREWLERTFPDRAAKVLNRIRSTRGGRLYDADFGTRGRGEGPVAEHIERLFRVSRRKAGLETPPPALRTDAFQRPAGEQLTLFA
ncbi:MAG: PA0069 family radical SAM protein [Gemmatimonadota bacterium]